MKNKINISILIITIFVAQLPLLSSAQDNVNSTSGNFTVAEGARVTISESAKINIGGNLTIEANITGKGELILNSNKNTFIDANNHSIENLVLASANRVELKSGLQIGSQLTILNGELHLNNFNLTINNDTELNENTLARVIENGAGKIITGEIPLCNSATPYTFTTTVNFGFAECPAIITATKRNPSNNIFYYNHPKISTQNFDILIPPPKS